MCTTIGLQKYARAKQLVELLLDYAAKPMQLALLYANHRNISRRVRVLMDCLAKVAGLIYCESN